MRSYTTMREVLAMASRARRPLEFDDFAGVHQRDKVVDELKRLKREGLIEAAVDFDSRGVCLTCAVSGLTDEGEEFYRLIEKDDAWAMMLATLKGAGIDLSYPLLKEICEEIVKRYVTSFIPNMQLSK